MSATITSFVPEKLRDICKKLNIEQTLSSYYFQSIGQVEACIKFVKWTVKKCFKGNVSVHLVLLLIRCMPMGVGLPSLTTLLFNRPIRGPVLRFNRALTN